MLQGYYRTEAKCWSSSSGGGKWLSKVAITLLLPTLISYWGGLPKIDILKVWSFAILANLKMGIRLRSMTRILISPFLLYLCPLYVHMWYQPCTLWLIPYGVWQVGWQIRRLAIFAPFSTFTSSYFLHQTIVCKLKPIIFLPGDYICKKGDVGMEMFIVSSGAVQVDIPWWSLSNSSSGSRVSCK